MDSNYLIAWIRASRAGQKYVAPVNPNLSKPPPKKKRKLISFKNFNPVKKYGQQMLSMSTSYKNDE